MVKHIKQGIFLSLRPICLKQTSIALRVSRAGYICRNVTLFQILFLKIEVSEGKNTLV